MKKIFTNGMLALGAILLAGSVLTANAAPAFTSDYLTNDLGPVAAGGSGDLSSPGDYYTYDATSTGTIFIQTDYSGDLNKLGYPNYGAGGYSTYFFYSIIEESGENDLLQINASDYTLTDQGWKFEYSVTEGTSYVIGYPNGGGKDMETGFAFTLVADGTSSPVAITNVEPAPSDTESVDYNTFNDIQIYASKGIESVSGGTLTYGDNQSITLTVGIGDNLEVNGPPGSQFIQFRATRSDNQGGNLLQKVAESGATSFTLTVMDVKAGGVLVTENETNNKYVTVNNGTVTLTYQIDSAPVYEAGQSSFPSTFYAYWAPGDESAVATMVFSKPIQSIEDPKITMGRVMPGSSSGESNYAEYPLSEDNYKIEGNKVIFDFAGVKRVSSGTAPSTITFGVQNVKGTNGMVVNFGDNGTVFVEYMSYNPGDAPGTPDVKPEPEPQPGYLKEATNLTPQISVGEPARVLQLTWDDETVQFNSNEAIAVSYEGEVLGNVTTAEMGLQNSGTGEASPLDDDSALNPGGEQTVATGQILNVNFSKISAAVGTYSFIIPEGLVKNADGNINPAQTVTVEVTDLASGLVSPASGFKFNYGEEVVITISFEGDEIESVVLVDSPVVTVYESSETTASQENPYEETLNWSDLGLTLNEEEVSVTISLGNALEPGTYYLSFNEGSVLIDNVPNETIETMFVVVGNTSAINSLNAEGVDAPVFNIQGVKVSGNLENLPAGIYVVNGKKVLVRK